MAVLTTIDTNRSQSDLAHLEGTTLHRHRVAEAQDARSLINALINECGPDLEACLASIDLENPQPDDLDILADVASMLSPEQMELLDNALNDTLVVMDPYEHGATRIDLPERTEGVVTIDADDTTGFLDPMPGQAGAEHRSYGHWAVDQITTILTGIHPQHGEVPINRTRVLALLKDARFKRVVRKTGVDINGLYRALDAHADHPVDDDETDASHDVPWLSHHQHRNERSHLYPPPAPEDCTPPGAQRPRPNAYQRGISMDQGTYNWDDAYTECLHHATDLLRRACDAPTEVERDTLVDMARALSRQVTSTRDMRSQAIKAVTSLFARRPAHA